jgi:SET domain-containing protein
MLQQSDAVVVKRSPGKGRGVFARRPIKRGEVIEKVPVILIPADLVLDNASGKVLDRYVFWWNKNTLAISLGYGSIYNHSFTPNAEYEQGYACITYRAIRDISPGEEIQINYQWDTEDYAEFGFKIVK